MQRTFTITLFKVSKGNKIIFFSLLNHIKNSLENFFSLKIFTEKTDFLNAYACCNDNNNIKQLLLISPLNDENKENENSPASDIVKEIPQSTTTKIGTPITNHNSQELCNKQQSETSISDSVSSIRNVSVIDNSSINILYKTASPQNKQIRPTSTPMHRMICTTVKQASFDSTSSSACQISTINHTNNDTNDVSPPVLRAIK